MPLSVRYFFAVRVVPPLIFNFRIDAAGTGMPTPN